MHEFTQIKLEIAQTRLKHAKLELDHKKMAMGEVKYHYERKLTAIANNATSERLRAIDESIEYWMNITV